MNTNINFGNNLYLFDFIFPYLKLKLIDKNYKQIRKTKIKDYELLKLVEHYRLESSFIFNVWIAYISLEVYKFVPKLFRKEIKFTMRNKLFILARVYFITNVTCCYFINTYSKFINNKN